MGEEWWKEREREQRWKMEDGKGDRKSKGAKEELEEVGEGEGWAEEESNLGFKRVMWTIHDTNGAFGWKS